MGSMWVIVAAGGPARWSFGRAADLSEGPSHLLRPIPPTVDPIGSHSPYKKALCLDAAQQSLFSFTQRRHENHHDPIYLC